MTGAQFVKLAFALHSAALVQADKTTVDFAVSSWGSAMKALAKLRNSAFGPADVATMGRAFQEVWAAIGGRFNAPLASEAARLVLANAILAYATNIRVEASELRQAGLAALSRKYPHQVKGCRMYLAAVTKETRSSIDRSRTHIVQLAASIQRAHAAIEASTALMRVAGTYFNPCDWKRLSRLCVFVQTAGTRHVQAQ
jgi:DNA repair ATPase RecN